MNATTIGLDLAKSVFQVHGVDATGAVAVKKRLRRAEVLRFFNGLPPCLVGMEACGTAHFWAREIAALGHEVRLMPPAYVKAYLRRQKNDAADAEAICEAVARPSMRFVPAKSVERQGVLALHRTRELLVRQRTALINAVRGHCAEFGIITAQGARRVGELLDRARGADASALPEEARFALGLLAEQLDALAARIHALDRRLLAWHRQDAASQRLATIPGVGVLTATALSASVADPAAFRSGREFAAFLGLVPRQTSSGGKERLGRITKMGDGQPRASCWWSGRRPSSGAPVPAHSRPPPGCVPCSSAGRRGWRASPWPTRPPGSSGRCWREKRATAPRERGDRDRGGRGRRSRTAGVAKGMMRI